MADGVMITFHLNTHRMTYNHDSEAYEADILLKLGYYNYQYLYTTHTEPHIGHTRSEGNFYQTENEYEILVYHCPDRWKILAVSGCCNTYIQGIS